MRTAPSAAAAAVIAALALPACFLHSPAPDSAISAEERARRDCKIAFARCAPPANFSADLEIDRLDVRSLVQISWRMDLDDAMTERAGKRLRKLAERGDLDTVREIARAGENAESTLGRCRCTGEDQRSQWEIQDIAALTAKRLPSAELQTPAYWAQRIDPHLAKLRALSRHSAELSAAGDEAGAAGSEAAVRTEEAALCQAVHAARQVLSDDGMTELRSLLFQARARASGEASVEVARRDLDHAERRPSCTADAGAPAE